MDETGNEITSPIDRARDRLGSGLRERGTKVDSAADWREHFRERPQVFLGAAFAGGVILATAGRTPPSAGIVVDQSGPRPQALNLWHNIQRALIGVARVRIEEYIGQLVPGFDEHYRRAGQRAATFDPTREPLGQTAG